MFNKLHSLGIGAHKALEICLSVNGRKVTRTMMGDAELALILPVLSESNAEILLSKEKFLLGTDAGKGGFGNSFSAVVAPDHPEGHFCVYIGQDLMELAEARHLDETGNDERFGELLGIPACCRSHFSAKKEKFSSDQNDPTNYIRQNGAVVPWCSHFPMYFGYGLFSHFPCSTNCSFTHEVALANEAFLRKASPKLADTFVRYQFMSYLYSEYDGIFAFEDIEGECQGANSNWTYDNKSLEATTNFSLLSDTIFSCDNVAVTDGEIVFRRGDVVRLLANSSKFRLGFHNESRP